MHNALISLRIEQFFIPALGHLSARLCMIAQSHKLKPSLIMFIQSSEALKASPKALDLAHGQVQQARN